VAQRRRIATVRIKSTRTVKVTGTFTQRITVRPSATQQARAISPPPRQITRRSTARYTEPERAFLGDVRDVVDSDLPRERDAFLCHAWNDRQGPANDFYLALREVGVDVWFSERDVQLGYSLPRQLDAGLRVSRVGIVLVTPAMLSALRAGGFADQELGALLGGGRVIPVIHGIDHDDLRNESPLLAARAGLSTEGSSFADTAAKIAESVLGVDLG
jgi:hypothetical protein